MEWTRGEGVGSQEMWTQEERMGISRHGGVVGDVGTGDERTRGSHREGKCIRTDMEEIYRENAEASKRGGKGTGRAWEHRHGDLKR